MACMTQTDTVLVITSSDGMYRYLNGELHRDDGPAVTLNNGEELWYKHGKLHREGGPALVSSKLGTYWYLNDQVHREDGPATIFYDDYSRRTVYGWYIRGRNYSFEQFCEVAEISDEDKLMLKLTY